MKKVKCPCCDFYTVESEDGVIVDICPVCFWQYDAAAHDKPNYMKGANHVTLHEARKNYKDFGVCDNRLAGKSLVREPLVDELPENSPGSG